MKKFLFAAIAALIAAPALAGQSCDFAATRQQIHVAQLEAENHELLMKIAQSPVRFAATVAAVPDLQQLKDAKKADGVVIEYTQRCPQLMALKASLASAQKAAADARLHDLASAGPLPYPFGLALPK